MYCWSCGEPLNEEVERCGSCGAGPGSSVTVTHPASVHKVRVSMCPGCGYVGEGVPYFRRASHAALLVGATLLTYGFGGLIYWLVKRDATVCPSCGLSWKRSRSLGTVPSADRLESGSGLWLRPWPRRTGELPRGGLVRRVAGVVMAILALALLGMGIVQVNAEPIIAGVSLGLVGASSFAWGLKALHRRREGLLRSLQNQVLHVAAARGGRLTATDVAADLELTLPAAERVLFSMDDGFRVRSDVTDEGLLLFDFPEIRARGLGGPVPGPSMLQPTQSPEDQ